MRSDEAVGSLVEEDIQCLYSQNEGLNEPLFVVGKMMITELRYGKGGQLAANGGRCMQVLPEHRASIDAHNSAIL